MTIYSLDELIFLFGTSLLFHAYRFLRRQVRWSGIPISFRIFQFLVIHTVKGVGIVNKTEIDVFLNLSCFFDYAKAFDWVDHKKLENSERDGNTRPRDLPLEKFVCRSGSNS